MCARFAILLALSCFSFHFTQSICHHLPSHPTHPSAHLRRRPLNCGYVPRARRHTGIIISPQRPHSVIPTPPRTLWSSGLCTFPTMSRRCPFHLFINNPLLCHHVPPTTPHTTSRNERLITASFLQPPPSHITPPPPAHPQLLGRRVTLRDFKFHLALDNRGHSRHCMSARACGPVSQPSSTTGRHGSL